MERKSSSVVRAELAALDSAASRHCTGKASAPCARMVHAAFELPDCNHTSKLCTCHTVCVPATACSLSLCTITLSWAMHQSYAGRTYT
eukprot:357346-Chlamydomonas_euryale.AAC.4